MRIMASVDEQEAEKDEDGNDCLRVAYIPEVRENEQHHNSCSDSYE